MSNGTFAVSLVVGAAVLALWVNARFPRQELALRKVVVHAIAAFVLLHLIPVSIGSIAAGFLIVFALVLPVLVYMFLTMVWFVRLTQNMLGTYR